MHFIHELHVTVRLRQLSSSHLSALFRKYLSRAENPGPTTPKTLIRARTKWAYSRILPEPRPARLIPECSIYSVGKSTLQLCTHEHEALSRA